MLTWQQILMQQHIRSFQLHFFLRETSLKYKCRLQITAFTGPVGLGRRNGYGFGRIESMEWVLTRVGKHGGGTMLPLAPRKCSNAATPRSTAFISSILPILLLNQPEVISTQQTAAKAPKEAFSKQWSNVNVGGRSWNWHWLCSQVVPN